MKVYVVYQENWRDSNNYETIAYEVAGIFETQEKAEEYFTEKVFDEGYIEEREVI